MVAELMIDKTLFVSVIVAMFFSLVMVFSLSTYPVLYNEYPVYHFLIRQIIAVSMGFLMIIILSKLDPDKWFNTLGLGIFLLFFIIMISMPFLPTSMVSDTGGAKRWIGFGFFKITPVEFFKVGFVFFLSWSFSRKILHRQNMTFSEEFVAYFPYLIVFVISAIFIAVLQKDLGQTMVLAATLLIMFIFAGSSLKFFLSLIGTALFGLIVLIKTAPHRVQRVVEWWATVQDPILSALPANLSNSLRVDAIAKESYQVSNSLNAINHGGFFGTGLGNGQFKLGYLSDVHTDFALAGVAEEFGFIGLFFVLGLMLIIIFRIFKIASRLENPVYSLFCIGVALLIGFAFIINSFGIAGITPVKGIAVPFLSYGGSQILALSVAIGMVLMVSKKMQTKKEMINSNEGEVWQ
ncbi:Cell division protein FtsW [Sulfurovum sp. enrichment culture clone C5]|uniref:Probable peptidoglycan glycosyltransferase FtsW n=1 Tax=Sulfurovum sp. enrichment culture clone C5 TaxID=497650 RepID=A0A0S4XLG1_9BACT|nr:Cell division protein FtsW [Sulfurovum sp. enrichment culture clone C5]